MRKTYEAPHYASFSSLSVIFFSSPNILHNTLSLRSFLSVRDRVLYPYKTKGNIIILYILIFMFLSSSIQSALICYCLKDSGHLSYTDKQTVRLVWWVNSLRHFLLKAVKLNVPDSTFVPSAQSNSHQNKLCAYWQAGDERRTWQPAGKECKDITERETVVHVDCHQQTTTAILLTAISRQTYMRYVRVV